MEKEENGCRSPSTASSSSESYWGWEWRRTMNIWTCVYCNLLYTSCIAWVITLATEIRQNEPPWASETSSDMWSPPRCSASLRSFGTLGGITYHCSFSSAHGGSFTYRPPNVGTIFCTNLLVQRVSPLLYISIKDIRQVLIYLWILSSIYSPISSEIL